MAICNKHFALPLEIAALEFPLGLIGGSQRRLRRRFDNPPLSCLPTSMITFENVTKTFNQTDVVKNLSFSVAKGQITCLIGTSGCGKTTTLKMINRLINPTSGRILINDRVQNTIPILELRRSIGYVIQEIGLFPHLTIFKNVWLLEEVKKIPKEKRIERAYEVLDSVGLNPSTYGDRYPKELSGGQRQRVGIARALMSDPDILLMDEPFGALDPITKNKMHQEFWDWNQKLNKTIVLVTHDLSEAFKLGEEIILMNKGEVIQKGKTKDIFINSPANEFVSEFVKSQMIQ